jgi:ribulose kinase
VPPGSDGIIALDTWQGSRTPFRDPHRRGAFTGLALGHGRAHLYRALLESVAYGGRQVTEAFDEAGTGLAELVLTGGGSGSQLWRQIHADVIGRPLLRLDQPQPAALGAAICAAAGLGACPDLRSAAAAMSRVVPGAQPDPGNRRAYETAFSTYQAAARALGPPGWGAPPPGSGPPG